MKSSWLQGARCQLRAINCDLETHSHSPHTVWVPGLPATSRSPPRSYRIGHALPNNYSCCCFGRPWMGPLLGGARVRVSSQHGLRARPSPLLNPGGDGLTPSGCGGGPCRQGETHPQRVRGEERLPELNPRTTLSLSRARARLFPSTNVWASSTCTRARTRKIQHPPPNKPRTMIQNSTCTPL